MRTLLVFVSLTLIAAPVIAQARPLDDRVRIIRSCDCPDVTGTLREWSQEQLILEVAGSDRLLVLPTSDVARLEVYQGSYAAEGALIGLGLAVTAAVLVSATTEDGLFLSAGQAGMFAGIFVGLLAVPIGTLAGRSHWKTAASSFDLGLAPTTEGGLAFGGTVRF